MVPLPSYQDHISDTLFFSYSSRTWTELAPMNTERMGHKLAWIDGKVAAIGGYLDNILKEIEVFDGKAWTAHPIPLTNARWAYGLADYIPSDVVSC